MEDLINRQAAINLLCEEAAGIDRNVTFAIAEIKQWCNELLSELDALGKAFGHDHMITAIRVLPSTAHEFIQCKDCKHFIRDDIEEYTPYGFSNYHMHFYCNKLEKDGDALEVWLDDYCSFAERREDERHDIQAEGD